MDLFLIQCLTNKETLSRPLPRYLRKGARHAGLILPAQSAQPSRLPLEQEVQLRRSPLFRIDQITRCVISGKPRSKDRCWRRECPSCWRYSRLIFDAYALDVFDNEIARDLELGNRQKDRRLLFVTFRGRPGLPWEVFTDGIEDHLLPWLEGKDRLGAIHACLGVYVSATVDASIHWHAIIDAESQLPRAWDVWANERPPTWARWSGDAPNALDIKLLRLPGEVRPWKSDRLRTIRELPDSDLSRDLVICSVDHIRYMADQFPTANVPRGHNALLTRRVSYRHASGFREFRDEWLERYRKLPQLDPDARGLAESEQEMLRLCSPTRTQWGWALSRFLRRYPDRRPARVPTVIHRQAA